MVATLANRRRFCLHARYFRHSTGFKQDVALVIDAVRRRGARLVAAWSGAARTLLLALAVAIGLAATALAAPSLAATPGTKVVRFDGYSVRVPASWPVLRLATDRTACVRFNRHAVYLGEPGAAQRCPTHAAGRTEAILIEPRGSATPALSAGGTLTRFAPRDSRVVVTATWAGNPATIEHALGRRVNARAATATAATPPRARPARKGPTGSAAVAGTTYTGYGFDACSAPSAAALAAWRGKSPFNAVGVYVGGANVACSQPNLTAAWVAEEAAAGWDMIPTYVGLQAPGACGGCASIASAKAAASEGTAAAENAVTEAQALGFGAGSPIYDDVEAYSTTSKNTTMVRTFLSAWTTELHALGYVSGVYSSSDSGIADLAAVFGTGYVEPDDLWTANWNNAANTADPKLPTADWADNQRIHQYRGGHTDTYGKVSLDIDTDYLDGSVAGTDAGTPAPGLAPVASVAPAADGSIAIRASWAGETGITGWQLLGGNSSTVLAPLGARSGGGQSRTITIRGQYAYFEVQALSSTGTALGSSETIATPPHVAIFGRSAFVPPHGLAGVPIGCFVPSGCRIVTTITAGRTLIGKTGADPVAAGTGGIAYFKPTAAGRSLLASAPGRRLAVTVTATDTGPLGSTGGVGSVPGSPTTAAPVHATVNLIPYATSGTSPAKSLVDVPALRILSATAYAYRDSVGGLLVDCISTAPCRTTLKLWHGHTTLATTGAQSLGAGEVGYLTFKLTSAGRSMLLSSQGNQIGAHVFIGDGAATASGVIGIVGYH
jgi:hypothetical protein